MQKVAGILLVLSVIACSEEVVERPAPANLIPEQNMIPLIIDLQILESHYQRTYSRPDVYKDALDSASQFIFQDHSVKRNQFEASYDYYAAEPDHLFAIYESALDTLNQRISDRTQQIIE